jgi:pre-mRNA-splicing factor RBM22/SLT11
LPKVSIYLVILGECKRGDACPYRHEAAPPTTSEEGGGPSRRRTHNNIKDRYAGRNDPVAKSMLKRVGGLTPPEDRSIVTLWISGLDEDINELDLRSHFASFGDLKSVSLLRKAKGAFVVFLTREGAEEAASVSSASGPFFNIKGKSLRIAWGKSKGRAQFRSGVRKGKEVEEGEKKVETAAGAVGGEGRVEQVSELDRVLNAGIAAPPGSGAVYYPSMNPS